MQWLWDNLGLVLGLIVGTRAIERDPDPGRFHSQHPARIARLPVARGAGGPAARSSASCSRFPSIALFLTLPVILGTKILDPLNVIVALSVYAVADHGAGRRGRLRLGLA